MTTITDRRGWLSKRRGLRNRGPATTAERMDRLRDELDALLDSPPPPEDLDKRFRAAEGGISPAGKEALLRKPSAKVMDYVARLLGGGDG